MHAAKIMHRDLKPNNLLIGKNSEDLKIADFGFARTLDENIDEESQVLTEHVVTQWYRAPEVMLSNGKYNGFMVDMWSAGCIWAEMYKKSPLFQANAKSVTVQLDVIFKSLGTPSEIELDKLRKGSTALRNHEFVAHNPRSLSEQIPTAPEAVVRLISRMLEIDPAKRISADEALKDPVFADFYDDALCNSQMPNFDLVGQIINRKCRPDEAQDLMLEEIRKFRPDATSPAS
eukprot:TRINITY_DN816_c0_g1_i3.p1 TRINITY_DN816_c0_g1~~TRINITY_DN816_c0_g1_i3.p1  ORF type:complete len:232 (+),score=55.88 TRINITY_DN816_c0_g1_i3:726-1421(+)